MLKKILPYAVIAGLILGTLLVVGSAQGAILQVFQGANGTSTTPSTGQFLGGYASGTKMCTSSTTACYGPWYFIAGANITLTTSTLGQLTITGSAGGAGVATTTLNGFTGTVFDLLAADGSIVRSVTNGSTTFRFSNVFGYSSTTINGQTGALTFASTSPIGLGISGNTFTWSCATCLTTYTASTTINGFNGQIFDIVAGNGLSRVTLNGSTTFNGVSTSTSNRWLGTQEFVIASGTQAIFASSTLNGSTTLPTGLWGVILATNATGQIVATTTAAAGGGGGAGGIVTSSPIFSSSVPFFTFGGSSSTVTTDSNFIYTSSTRQLKLGHTSSSLAIGDKYNDSLGPPAAFATGGTVVLSGGKEIHTFNSSGTLTFTSGNITVVDVLVIGGGGGGGGADTGGNTGSGGGGGAGGFQYVTSTAVSSTGAYSIVVGIGGAGGAAGGNNGIQGVTSTWNASGVGAVISSGGGFGSGVSAVAGANGASGGGARGTGGTSTGIAGQGNGGGTAVSGSNETGGGGGGATAVGVNGTTSNGGAGGAGTANSISGSSVTYSCGGGGGSGGGVGTNGAAGCAGAGMGGFVNNGGQNASSSLGMGGGGAARSGANQAGGNGGTGVVIVSFTNAGPVQNDYASSTFSLAIDGHFISGGATTTATSCGTSPSTSGNDTAGIVTIGSGVVTSCTINFGQAFISAPICVASDDSSILAVKPNANTSTLTLSTASTFAGDNVSYICLGL